MKHEKVKDSSQIYSTAHDGATNMAARFHCKCKGINQMCPICGGAGYSGTYTYEGVPPELHTRVRAGEVGGSVGKTFHALIIKAGFKFKYEPPA